MANSRQPVFELPISVPARGSRNRVRADLFAPLRKFYLRRPTQPGIVLGYGGIDDVSILEGLDRPRRALTR